MMENHRQKREVDFHITDHSVDAVHRINSSHLCMNAKLSFGNNNYPTKICTNDSMKNRNMPFEIDHPIDKGKVMIG